MRIEGDGNVKMDSFVDTTSNNESEISADESFYVSSPNNLNFNFNKIKTVKNDTQGGELLNANLKERLISIQNHLQRIEDKKKIIDERQVKQYSFEKLQILKSSIN